MADDDLDFGSTVRGYASGQKVFNRYTLQKMLGRGGMGVVWLAMDDELERKVALKFLPEIVAHDKQSVQDLKRETRRSLELTHPNIVRIYDFIQDDKAAAISMEFIDGDTLGSLKVDQPNGHFEAGALMGWMEQLCDALHYAHTQAEVVHRDLKPANLMIDAKGNLKIADFGIAASVSDSVSRVSQSAGSSGTPVYMSPQQMMGEPPSVTDDIYSLGATFYELLTSRPPFYRGNVMMQVMNKVPPNMAERRSQLQVAGDPIPEHWEKKITQCLAKEPADRPPMVQDVKYNLMHRPMPNGGGQGAGEDPMDIFKEVFGDKANFDPNAPQRGQDNKLQVPLLPEEMKAGCTRRVELGSTKEVIEVKIPAGVEVGTRIRLRGKGGAGTNGGEAGDLYLEVVEGMKASSKSAESPQPPPQPPPMPEAPSSAKTGDSKGKPEKKKPSQKKEEDSELTPIGIVLLLAFFAALIGLGVVKMGWLDGFDRPTPDTLVMVQGLEENFSADTSHKSVNGFYRVESAEANFSMVNDEAAIRDRSFYDWGDVITVQTNRWTGETTTGDQPVMVRVAVEAPDLGHSRSLEGMLNLKMSLEIPVLSEGTNGKEFTEEIVTWDEIYPVKIKPRESRPFTRLFTQIVLWLIIISFGYGLLRVIWLNDIKSTPVRVILNLIVFGGVGFLAFYRINAAEFAYLEERMRVRALARAEEALAQGNLEDAESLVGSVIAADPDNREAFRLQYKIEDMPREIRVPQDANTVRTAVEQARDNDTILISPGTYEGHVHFNKSIRVRGTGDSNEAVILQVTDPGPRETGRNVVTVGSDQVVTLEDLTIQHIGSMTEDRRPSAVSLSNDGSRLTLGNVQVRNGVGHGIAVSGGAQVRIHDSQIVDNAWRGIYVRGMNLEREQEELLMYADERYNLISGNASGGIRMIEYAKADLQYVEVMSNGTVGIELSEKSELVMDQVSIQNNEGWGVLANDEGTRVEASAVVYENNSSGNYGAQKGAVYETL